MDTRQLAPSSICYAFRLSITHVHFRTDWSTEDVCEYVGEVASGLRVTYTDFGETKRIYAHAGNSSCAIV
ncbi:hypothetical protein [Burkholderia gladioli]|uniref:hypothetical protein n=1 Tax=Burkholderia gladioli TaxID=28095 RepID=UPI001EE68539|nr:hypothetical protein [Burkholderia gladioli]